MGTLVATIRRTLRTRGVGGTALLCLNVPVAKFLRSDFRVRFSRALDGWMFDRRFGVDTCGYILRPSPSIRGSDPALGGPYDGTHRSHFRRVMRSLEIRYEEYAFVDFGSGKGRVLLLASEFPFRSIAGVEWSRELHDIAQRNIRRYRGPKVCDSIESICWDATQFEIPAGKAIFYFFNPFTDQILSRVLDNIRRSFEEHPRDMVIVYMNPPRRDVFDGAGFLEKKVDKWWVVVYQPHGCKDELSSLELPDFKHLWYDWSATR